MATTNKRIVYSGGITIYEADVCNQCKETIPLTALDAAYTVKFTLPDGKGIPVFRLCAACKKTPPVMLPAVNVQLHDITGVGSVSPRAG